MPLPVNTDVYQCRLIWRSSQAPRPASNNLYFWDTTGAQTATNLNTDFQANVTATMWNNCANSAVVTDVVVTPLDGATAGSTFTTGSPAKFTGSGGGEMILQGAEVVTCRTAHRGPSGRGRIYLPWIGESQQSQGTLDNAAVTAAQTAWNTFYTAILAAGWEPTLPDPNNTIGRTVTQYVVRPYLKTQRRRARR